MAQTISQALRRVKKLKGQLAELQGRCERALNYRQDAKPAFDFEASLQELNKVREELISLQSRVAVTNATTTMEFEGKRLTLAEAARRAQELTSQIAWYNRLPVQPGETVVTTEQRYSETKEGYVRVEVTTFCALPEAKRADAVRGLQDQFDALNDALETTNHRTVIADPSK